MGLGGLPHCIKKPAPFTLIRSPKSTYTERQHKGQGKGQHIISLCCSHGRTSEKGTGTQKETQFACLNYLINRKLINSSHTQGNSEGTQSRYANDNADGYANNIANDNAESKQINVAS